MKVTLIANRPVDGVDRMEITWSNWADVCVLLHEACGASPAVEIPSTGLEVTWTQAAGWADLLDEVIPDVVVEEYPDAAMTTGVRAELHVVGSDFPVPVHPLVVRRVLLESRGIRFPADLAGACKDSAYMCKALADSPGEGAWLEQLVRFLWLSDGVTVVEGSGRLGSLEGVASGTI